MKRLTLIGAGLAMLAGSGVAMAQMPPPSPGATDMHDGGGPGARFEMMRRMRHESGAAFRFRKGDASIGIKCPSAETVQACVSAAGTLIDKISSMPQPAAPKTP